MQTHSCFIIYLLMVYNPSALSVAEPPPYFVSVSFIGPTVINRTQIEFYCDISTTDTDPDARFNVTFLFNAEADDDVPVQVLTTDNLRATLHERYLAGRLNKEVRLWIKLSVTFTVGSKSVMRIPRPERPSLWMRNKTKIVNFHPPLCSVLWQLLSWHELDSLICQMIFVNLLSGNPKCDTG